MINSGRVINNKIDTGDLNVIKTDAILFFGKILLGLLNFPTKVV